MPHAEVSRPLVKIRGVQKQYGGPRPMRIERLVMSPGQALVLRGLDAAAAETLVNLLTGASIPDHGQIEIDGRDTRQISTDTEWLTSLDRFGLVTLRAVLIGALPVEQNLALPLTLSIDPMADDVRARIEGLADEVGLPRSRLRVPAHTLSPAELIRVHLARALALRPVLVLLEHPTAALDDPAEREAFGRLITAVTQARKVGWLAISNDQAFVHGTGRTAATLDPETGALRQGGAWWRRWLGGRTS